MIYSVTVKPNSKKGPLVIQDETSLTVFLREKPTNGEANVALMKILSRYFQVPKTQIRIKTGGHSRKKLIEIST